MTVSLPPTESISDLELYPVVPADVVDDEELLAILGLPLTQSPLDDDVSVAVLDWEDMPELSEEEDDDCSSIGKRKREEDDDLFAQLDFVEVPLSPKKPCFVEDDLSFTMYTQVVDDEDIRLALDLISS